MELDLKYLLDRPDDGWSADMDPTVDLPIGDAGRGLGNGRTQLLLPLSVQRSFGERLSMGGELFRRTSAAAGEPSAAGLNVGAIVSVAKNRSLLNSADRGLAHGETSSGSMFFAYPMAP